MTATSRHSVIVLPATRDTAVPRRPGPLTQLVITLDTALLQSTPKNRQMLQHPPAPRHPDHVLKLTDYHTIGHQLQGRQRPLQSPVERQLAYFRHLGRDVCHGVQ